MKYCKKAFSNYEEQCSFVMLCENEFENDLASAVNQVCETDELKVIGLSGPSCSGKTTTATKLIEALSKSGKKVHLVSIDNFFKDTARALESDEDIDFDSVNAIDLASFEECINEIFNCCPSHIPQFDFITGKRVGYAEIQPDPNDLYIFEGIQVVYPEINALLRRFKSKSIYIRANSGIDLDGVFFEPNEIRFMRRIVRDYNFRGASPEYSMLLWQSVRANEEKNIFPYADACDIQIDSTMAYEINLLSQFLRPLLLSVPENSDYIKIAAELIKKTEGIECVPQSIIPDNSLYYEFIKRI